MVFILYYVFKYDHNGTTNNLFSSTRSSQHRLSNLTKLLGITIITLIFPHIQHDCKAQDILSRVPAGIFSSPSSSRNSASDNNIGKILNRLAK